MAARTLKSSYNSISKHIPLIYSCYLVPQSSVQNCRSEEELKCQLFLEKL
jgi:hypothetical protein